MNMSCAHFSVAKPDSCEFLTIPDYMSCRSFFTVGINDAVIHSVVKDLIEPKNLKALEEITNVISLVNLSDDSLTKSRKELLGKNMPKLLVLVKHLAGEATPST